MASINLRDDLADRCLASLALLHDIPLEKLKSEYLNLVMVLKMRKARKGKGMQRGGVEEEVELNVLIL